MFLFMFDPYLRLKMYLLIIILSLGLSLTETTGVEEYFHEAHVRNSYQCESLCDVTRNCEGYVFNLKNRTCSLVSTQFLQRASIVEDFYTITFNKEGGIFQCKDRRGCGKDGICVTMEDGLTSDCLPVPTCATPPDFPTLHTPDVEISPMGTEVTYTCQVGYNRTAGDGLSVCKSDQQWSTHSLTCEIIDCGKPPDIPYMAISPFSATTYDTSILYACILGFFAASGSGDSVCKETGAWLTPTLVCEIVDCGLPLAIDRMDLGQVTNTTFSFEVSYSCSLGFYETSGSGDSTCQQNKTWSTPTLVCEVVDCGKPPEIPTMSVGSISATVYDSLAVYSCLLGYNYVSGNGSSVCQQSRRWSPPPLVCKIKDCGKPPSVSKMYINTSRGTKYGTSLYYGCTLGYHPASGIGKITCLDTELWSLHTLVCEDKSKRLVDRNSSDHSQTSSVNYERLWVQYYHYPTRDYFISSGHYRTLSTKKLLTSTFFTKPLGDHIPGLLTKRGLGIGEKTLTCRTVSVSYKVDATTPPTVACDGDEMLTDCSAKGDTLQPGENGIQMIVVGNRVQCLVRYVKNSGVASARCCKAHGLSCEYIKRGPSVVANDASIKVPCYKGFITLGCNAYSDNGQIDGDYVSSKKCYGQLGKEATEGAYGNAACCYAPRMKCEQRSLTDIARVNKEMIASCPAGFVLTGCAGRDKWGYSRGTYIHEDECRLSTTNGKSEVYITCCNATLS